MFWRLCIQVVKERQRAILQEGRFMNRYALAFHQDMLDKMKPAMQVHMWDGALL